MNEEFAAYVRQAHKPRKAAACRIITGLAEQLPDHRPELAELYQYFRPPLGSIKAAAKDPWKWISLAVANQDVRRYLNYINVEKRRAMGCDGYRIHMFKTTEKSGFYDARTHDRLFTRSEAKKEKLKYPDIDAVLMGDQKHSTLKLGEIETKATMAGSIESVIIPGLRKGMGVCAQYWDQAVCIFGPDADVKISETMIQIEDGKHTSVVMGIRL